MKLQRDWATPLTMGAFGLLAVTGVLMFFHLDTGLNKTAHEWLGWVLLAGVAAHAAVNWPMLERHLAATRGRVILALFGLLLALSFIGPGGAAKAPAFVAPVNALARAPLPVLARVVDVSPDELRLRFEQAGHAVAGNDTTVQSLVGGDARAQARLLEQLVSPAAR